MFMEWLGERPSIYIVELEQEFSGRVIKKYFRKTTHYILRSDNKEIDIAGLSMELVNNIEIGDSLIKIKNSNCCILIKDTTKVILKYTGIPDDVLERSEYLRELYERDCSELIETEH